MISVDHRVLISTGREATLCSQVRKLVKEMGIRHYYEVGRHGIGHQLCVEQGLVRPGMLVIGSDTHTPTCGGVGAFAIGVNQDLPYLLATGELWVMVPETIRVNVIGELTGGASARDVALTICNMIGPEVGNYRVIEFDGPGLDTFGIDERLTLCNFASEIGAKTAIAVPNESVLKYAQERSGVVCEPVRSDSDADFACEYTLDLSTITPCVAYPPSPDNIKPVSEIDNIDIDWAFIGSCASGRMNDLTTAAKIMQGQKVHPRVKLVISPATQEMYLNALKEGLLEIFVKANAVIAPPSCGACYGSMVQLADGEVCISTGTRNEPGRMGSRKADIYLASAATVAISALRGRISGLQKM